MGNHFFVRPESPAKAGLPERSDLPDLHGVNEEPVHLRSRVEESIADEPERVPSRYAPRGSFIDVRA